MAADNLPPGTPPTPLVRDARPTSTTRWLTIAALFALCSIPFLRSYEQRERPLGEDEIYWIGQAYYFHLACEERDWANPDWQLLPARENPALEKYLIGLGLKLQGLSITNVDWLGVFFLIARDRPNAWGDQRDQQQRRAVVERMKPDVRDRAIKDGAFEHPPRIVTAARLIMLLSGTLAVLGVFVLTRLHTGDMPAVLAALLFSLHPAVTSAYTEVGVDILAITFSVFAVIFFTMMARCAWRGCRRPRLCRVLISASGGLSLALAVGSKMNAATVGMLGTALCLWFGVQWIRNHSEEAKDAFQAVFLMMIIAMVLFIGSNPTNFPNPVSGLWAAYADAQRSLEIQKSAGPIPGPLETWIERLWATVVVTAFHPALFALVLAAFVFHILQAWRRRMPPTLIAGWWAIAVVMISAWLPFPRPRYLLPVIVPSVILVSVATGALLSAILNKPHRAS